MTNEQPDSLPAIDSWDTYWQGAEASAAFTSGGSSHPLVLSFWNDYFTAARARGTDLKIIDIASGNGAVVECANAVFGESLPDFTCLDVSAAAIKMLEKRFPSVTGVVSDAGSIALDSATYDIATSQFGVEYAGLDALAEVARLVAPGGEIAMLLHHRGGSIYSQCVASLDAISAMQAANFLPLCKAVFETGFALAKGGSRDRYSVAGKQFAPAIRAVEDIIARHGSDVADGTIIRLYRDIRSIHSNMSRYEPSDVLDWLDNMQRELDAYGGRMTSMRDVAIDESRFEQECGKLSDGGFDIQRAEPLSRSDMDAPLSWALIATRR